MNIKEFFKRDNLDEMQKQTLLKIESCGFWALWVLLALSVGLPLWLDGSFGPLAAAAGYGLAVWYGFRNLDGMSGDISGFALTIGELCGCGAAILWR